MQENTPLLTSSGIRGGEERRASGGSSWRDCCGRLLGREDRHDHETSSYKPRKIPMKIEPKVFLANERTMLSWLHMSVVLGSIAAAMISADHPTSSIVGMLLLPVSVLFAVYALVTFYWRAKGISHRNNDVPFHDLVGPTILASVLAVALTAIFFVHLTEA